MLKYIPVRYYVDTREVDLNDRLVVRMTTGETLWFKYQEAEQLSARFVIDAKRTSDSILKEARALLAEKPNRGGPVRNVIIWFEEENSLHPNHTPQPQAGDPFRLIVREGSSRFSSYDFIPKGANGPLLVAEVFGTEIDPGPYDELRGVGEVFQA